MKYSIIVPIYNVEAYLNECIDSVINQTYDNWELILVDDGSPDNCPSICDSYASIESRIKVIHKANGGLVSARKAGVNIASGDYVICLDGDDFLNTTCLQIINNYVMKHHPDVLCHGYTEYCNGKKKDIQIKHYRNGFYDRRALEVEILPRLLYTENGYFFPRMVWAKAFNIEIYKKKQLAVSSDITMGEDGACSYPIICHASSMLIIPDCLHFYRQINTSMTKVKKPLLWRNYDILYNHYLNNMPLEEYNLMEQMYRARTHSLFNICMSQFYSGVDEKIIKKLLNSKLDIDEYKIAITRSTFSSLKLLLCKYILKRRLFYVLKFYANYKDLLKTVLKQ